MKSLRYATLAILAHPIICTSTQSTIPDDLKRTCHHLKIYMGAFSTHNEIFTFIRNNQELASEESRAYRQATESNRLRIDKESYRSMDQTIKYWEQLVPWVISLDPDVNPPVPEDPTKLIENIQSKSDLIQKIDEFCERTVNCLGSFWMNCPVDEVHVDIVALSLGIKNLKMAANQLPTNFGSVESSGQSGQP